MPQYTPPPSDAADFDLVSYTPPPPDTADFALSESGSVSPPVQEWRLDSPTASITSTDAVPSLRTVGGSIETVGGVIQTEG